MYDNIYNVVTSHNVKPLGVSLEQFLLPNIDGHIVAMHALTSAQNRIFMVMLNARCDYSFEEWCSSNLTFVPKDFSQRYF